MNCTSLKRSDQVESSRRRMRRSDRKGSYTVEFAICATVFFTCIFACFELARYVYVRQALEQTAYDACREGIIRGANSGDVVDRANVLLAAYGVNVAGVNVTPAVIDEQTMEVSVTINCNFADNTWVIPEFVTSGELTTSITLDHENRAFLTPEDSTDSSDLNNNDEPLDV